MLPPRATGPRLTECLSFIQKRPRGSQGTAVRSVAASRAVLPHDAEDFEVWERGADWNDLDFYISRGRKISKIAIVAELRWSLSRLRLQERESVARQ